MKPVKMKKRSAAVSLVSRRSFVRGLPAGLAGLSIMTPFWDRLIRRAVAQTVSQQRLLVWYVPDGLVTEWFWPAQAGALNIRSDRTNDLSGTTFNTAISAADAATFLLQPIAGYSARTLMVKGINNPGAADHTYSTQSCLTGDAVKSGAAGTSVSLDVLMSEANLTQNHALPVFRTGVYGSRTSYTGTRDLCRPRNNGNKWIEPSWQPTTDARALLDAVAGTGTGSTPDAAALRSASRLAVLGSVKSRVEALRCAAGTPAAHRLEAYVAEVARLETLEKQIRPTMPMPFTPNIDPNNATVKAAQSDIARIADVAPFLRELVVTAFALDYAPAVTLQWGASGTNQISGNKLIDYRYDFLPNIEYKGAGEHGLAHPEDGAFIDAGHRISAAVSTRDRVRIRRWYFDQMKQLLDRLAAVPDGAGTLLDHTTILHVSEFGGPRANSTADQHSNKNLPYMLVAGAQTPFKTGEALFVNNRTHGDFLLTLAQGFGSTATTMGVGTSRIDGILR
jgi:uncharacterized protein DUF1552